MNMYASTYVGGCLLSVNAGYLNAITFLEAGVSINVWWLTMYVCA